MGYRGSKPRAFECMYNLLYLDERPFFRMAMVHGLTYLRGSFPRGARSMPRADGHALHQLAASIYL